MPSPLTTTLRTGTGRRSHRALLALLALAGAALVVTPGPARALAPDGYEARVVRLLDDRRPPAPALSSTSPTAGCMDRQVEGALQARRPAPGPARLEARCGLGSAVVSVLRRAGSPAAAAARLAARPAVAAALSDPAVDDVSVAARRTARDGWTVVLALGARSGDSTPEPEPQDVRLEIVRLTNVERDRAGAAPLSPEECLMANAQRHAGRLAAQGSLSHQDLDDVRAECGVTGWVGENVLYNHDGSARAAVAQWMGSRGHRENMLFDGFAVIGVGSHLDEATGRTYAVQVFGGGVR